MVSRRWVGAPKRRLQRPWRRSCGPLADVRSSAKRCARRPRAAHDDGVVMVSLHHDPLTQTKKEAPRVFNGRPAARQQVLLFPLILSKTP